MQALEQGSRSRRHAGTPDCSLGKPSGLQYLLTLLQHLNLHAGLGQHPVAGSKGNNDELCEPGHCAEFQGCLAARMATKGLSYKGQLQGGWLLVPLI